MTVILFLAKSSRTEKSRVGSVDHRFGGNPTPVQIVFQNTVKLTK